MKRIVAAVSGGCVALRGYAGRGTTAITVTHRGGTLVARSPRWYLLCLTLLVAPVFAAQPPPPEAFVVQLTRSAGDFGHRRALLQIDKVLDDVGEARVHFEVIAYEEGIQALLNDNEQTIHLLTKLAQRGVVFKACRISMRAWQLSEDDFPLEVDYVDAGAPAMIERRLQGYGYWRP